MEIVSSAGGLGSVSATDESTLVEIAIGSLAVSIYALARRLEKAEYRVYNNA